MFLHPEILDPLAAAVEAFAALFDDASNKSTIASTAQVAELFIAALRRVSAPLSPEFQMGGVRVDALREDQRLVREWLDELSALAPATPRLTSQTAQQLRRRLAPTLRRLRFITVVDYAAAGAELRLYPTRFGVEAACYLVIATGLEPGAPVRVVRCKDCGHFVIQTRGRGKPREHCHEHSSARHKQRKEP